MALAPDGGDQLDRHRAEAARCAPDQDVVARADDVRAMAEQHAIGGGKHQDVGGALFPGQMLGPLEQLAVLHAAELREGAIRRLVTPDALRGREHRITAVAFLVVAVVLVAVDDDLVAHLPALHLRSDRVDDAGRVGAGDVIGVLMHVLDRRDRHAERGPHAVVVDARRHHEDEHVVAVELPGRQHLDLHGLVGRPVALGPDGPRIHLWAHARAAGSRRLRRDLCAPVPAQRPEPQRSVIGTTLAVAADARFVRSLICACCHASNLPRTSGPAATRVGGDRGPYLAP